MEFPKHFKLSELVRTDTGLPNVPTWEEAGNVYLPPMDAEHPWVREYIDELLAFPNGEHDDRVDATTQALDRLSTGSRGIVGML